MKESTATAKEESIDPIEKGVNQAVEMMVKKGAAMDVPPAQLERAEMSLRITYFQAVAATVHQIKKRSNELTTNEEKEHYLDNLLSMAMMRSICIVADKRDPGPNVVGDINDVK